jgi:hypothetical protein
MPTPLPIAQAILLRTNIHMSTVHFITVLLHCSEQRFSMPDIKHCDTDASSNMASIDDLFSLQPRMPPASHALDGIPDVSTRAPACCQCAITAPHFPRFSASRNEAALLLVRSRQPLLYRILAKPWRHTLPVQEMRENKLIRHLLGSLGLGCEEDKLGARRRRVDCHMYIAGQHRVIKADMIAPLSTHRSRVGTGPLERRAWP